MSYDADVVVAGGGPVGLMLACELRLAGASVTVLDRLTAIDPTVKAGSLTVPTVAAFHRRGLLSQLEEAQQHNLRGFAPKATAGPKATGPKFLGHFGGIMLTSDHLDPSSQAGEHGPAAGITLVAQQQVEAILAERAAELGVDVRRGVEVTGIAPDDDGVTVTTDQGPVRGRWLVGCDGGRSIVRKLAGFDFPGTDPEITAYQAMAEMEGTEALPTGWHATPTGVYVYGPHPRRILVVEFGGTPADRDAPVTTAELEASIRRVTGVDVVVTAINSVTRFTDNTRQASTYRLGRVLLAGDAAHVHPPFGGQGLNLGVGDAVNLGWKLAAVIRGHAPDGLLDTYTTERHPVGAWVLDWTRAQIAIMRPDPHARALRQVVTDLAGTTDGTTYLADRLSGVWQRHDIPGDHPLVGTNASDLELADGSRLADHMHDGRALLLDPSGELSVAAHGYDDRLKVTDGPFGLLVRPDGIVAWASDEGAEPHGLDKALSTWLGAPGSPAAA
ncbi:FAD-dependent monooxygenase [Microtetraspora malaysiensis]|uniref:FAD-dependent monooxygenase n=1 Tax=Microtetraspora malaysiensis TaxID=161358 RepID=UPI003D919841